MERLDRGFESQHAKGKALRQAVLSGLLPETVQERTRGRRPDVRVSVQELPHCARN